MFNRFWLTLLISVVTLSAKASPFYDINLLEPYAKSSGTHELASYETSFGGIVYLLGTQLGKAIYIDSALTSEVVQLVESITNFEDIRFALLNSPGGELEAGIMLGEIFRSKGITTIQDSETYCYSACFVAFLGGDSRLLTINSYTKDDVPRLKKNGILSSHTPYYVNGENITHLKINSPIGQEVCTYVDRMVGSKTGKRVCFDMFNTKGSSVYSAHYLKSLNIITDFTVNYARNFVVNYVISDDSKWFANCFVSATDVRNDSFGKCYSIARECAEKSSGNNEEFWNNYKLCIEKRGIPFWKGGVLHSPLDNLIILAKRAIELGMY